MILTYTISGWASLCDKALFPNLFHFIQNSCTLHAEIVVARANLLRDQGITQCSLANLLPGAMGHPADIQVDLSQVCSPNENLSNVFAYVASVQGCDCQDCYCLYLQRNFICRSSAKTDIDGLGSLQTKSVIISGMRNWMMARSMTNMRAMSC